MEFLEVIKTIIKSNEFEFKEKGSRFIGFATPCSSEEEAQKILEEKRKQYFDATHNCFAYAILPDVVKYSDDGEPNGTAGIRIYNAIQHFELTNLIVIVTRYFGGTKLGVGPLGKAYYNSAYGVLDSAKFITKKNYSLFDLVYDYEHSKTVHHFLDKHNCIIKENKFKQKPVISFLIKPSEIDDFKSGIVNATRGSVKLKPVEANLFVEIS